jgi:hypothetical protein
MRSVASLPNAARSVLAASSGRWRRQDQRQRLADVIHVRDVITADNNSHPQRLRIDMQV